MSSDADLVPLLSSSILTLSYGSFFTVAFELAQSGQKTIRKALKGKFANFYPHLYLSEFGI